MNDTGNDWFGYAGHILYVDLSKKKTRIENLTKNLVRSYIGGRGINTRLAYEQIKPGVDPLSPENALVFGTGPMAGIWLSSARWNVTTKSPLTGIFGDGNAGGHWAVGLKSSGFDHVVINGRSDTPVYLLLDNGQAEIRDARGIWGQDIWSASEMIQDEIGDKSAKVAGIGQAGENLVRYACVISDFTRAANRPGAGAVMGSKNLKAIAARETLDIKIARPEELAELIRECIGKVKKNPQYEWFNIAGTVASVTPSCEMGRGQWKNMQRGRPPHPEKLGAEAFLPFVKKSKACYGCFYHCSHYYEVNAGKYAGEHGEGLELGTCYEGSRMGIESMPFFLHYNTLCNKYGLDTFGTGGCIAWAMECFERGILTLKDTGGIELRFGNEEAALEMLEHIVYRKGFGDILAEGLLIAPKKLGRGSEKYANHIKGLSMNSEIRGVPIYCLGLVISNVGAQHLRGAPMAIMPGRSMSPELAEELVGSKEAVLPGIHNKAPLIVYEEVGDVIIDSLELCKFICTPHAGPTLLYFTEFSRLMKVVTGLDFSKQEFVEIGNRVMNLERAFNARDGAGRNIEKVPARMKEPLPDGYFKGEYVREDVLNVMLDEYYELRGWDKETGYPTQQKLKELGLDFVIRDIWKNKSEKTKRLRKKTPIAARS